MLSKWSLLKYSFFQFVTLSRSLPSPSPNLSLARSVSLWIFAHVDRVFISPCWWLLLRIHQPFFSRPMESEFEVGYRFAALAPSKSFSSLILHTHRREIERYRTLLFKGNGRNMFRWKLKIACRRVNAMSDAFTRINFFRVKLFEFTNSYIFRSNYNFKGIRSNIFSKRKKIITCTINWVIENKFSIARKKFSTQIKSWNFW